MRLSHLLLAVVSLLPLSTQAITLDKIGGHWVSTDITCKPNPRQFVVCEYIISPKNKSVGDVNLAINGKKVGKTGVISIAEEDVWYISLNGDVIEALEYESGYLYDSAGEKYHRVRK